MNRNIISLFIAIFLSLNGFACSMCKIQAEDEVFVGNNEDAWGNFARIYFEPKGSKKHGVAYFKHRLFDNGVQGGVNDAGLSCDALTVFEIIGSKNYRSDRSHILLDVLSECSSVRDVEVWIHENYWLFPTANVWFIDATGESLVVEPDTMYYEQNDFAVLSNYLPSLYFEDTSAIPLPRFHTALKHLQRTPTASLSNCTEVMQKMHACRGELGEGTLYTSIYDLTRGDIHLYFYHDYSRRVTLNIHEELKKGRHDISIPELFPANKEFKKLVAYKTTHNSSFVRYLFVALAAGILLFNLFLFVRYVVRLLRRRLKLFSRETLIITLLSLTNFGVLILIALILIKEPIFYFGIEGNAGNINFPIEYFPLGLIVSSVSITLLAIPQLRQRQWQFSKIVLASNLTSYFIIIGFSYYWGLLIP